MPDPIITSELTIPPLKPGYQTTEGAAALVGVLAPLAAAVVGSSALQANPWALVALIGIIAAVAIAYIFARTWLKRGSPLAVLVLSAIALTSSACTRTEGSLAAAGTIVGVLLVWKAAPFLRWWLRGLGAILFFVLLLAAPARAQGPAAPAATTATAAAAPAAGTPVDSTAAAAALPSEATAAAASTPPPAAAPDVTDLVARLRALDTALHELEQRVGVPQGPLPASFWSTKAGVAVQVTLAVSGALVGAATVGLQVYAATRGP